MTTTNHVYSELIGKTATECILERHGEEMVLRFSDGDARWYHEQDCCETVYIEDICGDPSCLVGSPIVEAEEVSNYEGPARGSCVESYTWTFYRFATAKGAVTVRWYGESNGYYSEQVDYLAPGQTSKWA